MHPEEMLFSSGTPRASMLGNLGFPACHFPCHFSALESYTSGSVVTESPSRPITGPVKPHYYTSNAIPQCHISLSTVAECLAEKQQQLQQHLLPCDF